MKIKSRSISLSILSLTTSLALGQAAPLTQVTTGDIVNDLGAWVGSVWADFNNDGFPDLFICNAGGNQNGFYLNNGNGTFTKITQGDPAQDSADGHIGAAVADYDNDGHLDLVLTSGVGASTPRLATLYQNDEAGGFTRRSAGTLSDQPGYFGPCAWADYDRDGFVDLFLADHGDSDDNGGKNRLFKNNGDGTFTRITAGRIVNDISVGYGCLWADYDNDGFPDLLVLNAGSNGSNFLYHNNGNGTFTRAANAIGSDRWTEGAVGGGWADFNNDGWLDLFVTGNDGTNNRLYRNNGDGTFTALPNMPMSTREVGAQTLGCAWGDYDNDGYLDLLVTARFGRNRLFHNNGDGGFTEILEGAPVTGIQTNSASWGVNWVDYDNDGALDLFLSRISTDGTDLPNALYHNTGNTNAWLQIKLAGTVGNAASIGAKIRLSTTLGGKLVTQLREINSGELTAHFGLGNATHAELIRIEWPSGTVQEFHNVPAKQRLTYTEPPRLLATIQQGVPHLALRGARGQYQLTSSRDLASWTELSTLTITNQNRSADFIDAAVTNFSPRFYRALSK